MSVVESQPLPRTVSEYEQERGKPMPSKNHGLVQLYLGSALLRYQEEYTIVSELSLNLGGRLLVPDLCVYPKLEVDWRQDEVSMSDPPLLVVEIQSPTQSMDELVRKSETYFEGGVRSCWIVEPSIKGVIVLLPGEERARVYTSGEVEDPATGITVQIDDIFRS